MLLDERIYSVLVVLGGAVGYAIGGFTMATKTLLILMGIDVISQLIVAGVFHNSPKSENGGLQSHTCWKGICKKLMTIFCIVVAQQLEYTTGIPAVKDLTVTGFIISEAISILENAGEMGIKLPKKLRDCIDVLRDKEESK